MKLVVQIPCFNEENTLPATLAAIPRDIPGIDEVVILVIDDGSSDATLAVARAHGVDYICHHRSNQGLGRAFRTGMDYALQLGADIIVNTDADGQYVGADIPKLIAPILAQQADIVVGDRQTASNPEFSFTKKCLQRLGSYVVRALSGTDIADAVSGFRAISRSAAIQLNILSKFSYTIEMIIQASNKQLTTVSVPVRTNASTRESRLFRNIPLFIARQLVSMVRMYAMYQPMRFFFYLGTVFTIGGLLPILRFLVVYLSGDGAGKVQSLIFGGALLTMGTMIYIAGLLADLISQNRQLSEITLAKVRALELHAQLTASQSPGGGDNRVV